MDYITIGGIAVGLSMDAFSVSVASTIKLDRMTWRQSLRMSAAFGGFQFLMPVVGYFAGVHVEKLVKSYDHWIAFALLVAVGLKMIIDTFKHHQEDAPKGDPTTGLTLLVLAVATSVDAVAVGFSFGMLKSGIWIPSVVIGVVCFVLTYIGTHVGKKLGEIGGCWVERFGGAVLIAIGAKILYEHLR